MHLHWTELLKSKPHKDNYLNRYIRFISSRQERVLDNTQYFEIHHICPKDMFPEYSQIKNFPWNGIKLTGREHFIVHMILWKAFPEFKGMMTSFWMMSNFRNIKTGVVYEKVRKEYISQTKPLLKDVNKNKVNVFDELGRLIKVSTSNTNFLNGSYTAQFKGTVVVKDKEGKKFRVNINDSRLKSNVLVGHTKGKTHVMDRDGNYVETYTNDPRIKLGILKGNNKGKIYINDGKNNRRISSDDDIPQGWKLGMFRSNSPKGSKWINNGVIEKMSHDSITPGWCYGRLPK